MKCGICECDPSHYGRQCECDLDTIRLMEDSLACRPDNTTTVDCNGRGTCVCGQCQCNLRSNPNEVCSSFQFYNFAYPTKFGVIYPYFTAFHLGGSDLQRSRIN